MGLNMILIWILILMAIFVFVLLSGYISTLEYQLPSPDLQFGALNAQLRPVFDHFMTILISRLVDFLILILVGFLKLVFTWLRMSRCIWLRMPHDYECRSCITTNVGMYMTPNVGPRRRMCGRKFRMSRSVQITSSFRISGYPRNSQMPCLYGHVYCLSGKRSRFFIFSCFSRTVTPGIYPGVFYFYFWICFGGPINFYLEQSHQVPGFFFIFFRVEHSHVDQILLFFFLSGDFL